MRSVCGWKHLTTFLNGANNINSPLVKRRLSRDFILQLRFLYRLIRDEEEAATHTEEDGMMNLLVVCSIPSWGTSCVSCGCLMHGPHSPPSDAAAAADDAELLRQEAVRDEIFIFLLFPLFGGKWIIKSLFRKVINDMQIKEILQSGRFSQHQSNMANKRPLRGGRCCAGEENNGFSISRKLSLIWELGKKNEEKKQQEQQQS